MNNYVKRVEDHFEVNGQPFKFVGFNMRGLAHYGDPNILPGSTGDDQIFFLKAAQEAGSAVIRIFLAHWSNRDDELINRLRQILDKAAVHQQRIIVCLTDHYETSKYQHWSFYNPDGSPKDEFICQPRIGQFKCLSPEFYASLYKGSFLAYVKKVVETFKDHPAVFCWELLNEGNNHGRQDVQYTHADILKMHDDFINFCTDMANEIRAIDPNHMVTVGIISTGTIEFKDEHNNARERLYTNLDFITLHDYENESANCNAELDLIRRPQVNKPFIVEEAGREHANADVFRKDLMDHWFGHGASGFLGWAFQPRMNGDGDDKHGINVSDGNYPQIIQLWRDRAASFPPVPPVS